MTMLDSQQYPSKLCLNKYVTFFIILKSNYFLLWFLYKSDLRISTVGKKRLIRIIHFKKNDNILHIVNRALPYLYGGSLEITQAVPLKCIKPAFCLEHSECKNVCIVSRYRREGGIQDTEEQR